MIHGLYANPHRVPVQRRSGISPLLHMLMPQRTRPQTAGRVSAAQVLLLGPTESMRPMEPLARQHCGIHQPMVQDLAGASPTGIRLTSDPPPSEWQ